MKYNEFINLDNWIGGFYELSIEFHPVGDDKRLNDALKSLEKSNVINGIWKEQEDYQKKRVSLPIEIEEDSVNQYYGTLLISDGNTLPCVITIIRVDVESDWLDVSIPQAAFEKAYPYKYPLTENLNPWLNEVAETFIKLAEIIYEQSPFDLAMIGEEISGYTNQEDITLEQLKKSTFIIPIVLQKRLETQEQGEALSNELKLFR
ncbi:hypothetical protein E3U55_04540 [Filobacillus milosensis]|uniref:Uncharacterized protein n=1 Tax=Filobacillus milosensis TaxID=94137 RepID=A0A4Y8IRA4_9BACI|nr:hypothetical protein [Filobacillus milosensis]TFB24086.1 hypothetical protein E3U55_04540 [Filobacillus milosensis]